VEEKRKRVITSVARFAELANVPIRATRAIGAQHAYRQRAKLVADAQGQLGLYRAGTHDVEDLPGCIVLDPNVQSTVIAARELLQRQPLLRGLDVVRVDDGVLVTLITSDAAEEREVLEFADRLLARAPFIVGVARSERASDAVQLLGKNLRLVRGESHAPYTLRDGAPYCLVAPGSFVQAHREVAAAIQTHILAALRDANIAPPARILELYAGSGSLALSLARTGFDVTAVESFAPACAQLREAARAQQLQLSVETADAAEGAKRAASNGQVDAVLVNPPRRGLDPEVRRAVARLRPRLITYVSCEPDTLARDLSDFACLGYAARELVPFDMMPLTHQVETVAVLEPHEPTPLDVLYEDDALLALNKRPHESVLPCAGHPPSLLERVRERAGYEGAAAIAPLDLAASGICLFVREPASACEVEESLALGTTHYLALVRGVVRNGGKITRPLLESAGRAEAVTRFRRREVLGGHSLVRATPLSREGARQVARHLAALGHPILGDASHGDVRSNRHLALKHRLERSFLHREHVELPLRTGTLVLRAQLAPDLALVLESLRNVRADRRETP
jgi:23S rRNA (uracil1939-C5)-methyltransferase